MLRKQLTNVGTQLFIAHQFAHELSDGCVGKIEFLPKLEMTYAFPRNRVEHM